LVLFENDTNFLVIERDENVVRHNVNEVTKKFKYWFKKNNIMINAGKMVEMSFHTKLNRFFLRSKITFRNMNIADKSESKFLGIHITEILKWKAHVCSLSLKLSKVSYLIKSTKKIMRSCMIRSIFHSKFLSLLRYGTIFFQGKIMKVYLYFRCRRGLFG
jgi:hypothetical protein